VADSVPVPLNGSDLKPHLIVNPSSMCHISRLCCPPSPRMSGRVFYPHQMWQTFFLDLWEKTLPQSSHRFLSRPYPLPPQACLPSPPSHVDYALCLSMTSFISFSIYSTTLPVPRVTTVMIREEPREFGIAMVAQPLLWACLRECLYF
jgi:hypothetical protein